MPTILLLLLIGQISEAKAETFQHDTPYKFTPEFAASLEPLRTHLREITEKARYDEIAEEFKRRNAEWSKNTAERIRGMGTMLDVVALTPIITESKESVYGRTDARIREICLPYAKAQTLRELSIPADPLVLDAQIQMASTVILTISPKLKVQLEQSEPLRRETLQPTIRVWARIVRTCLVYKEMYPEEEMVALSSGKSQLKIPDLPKNPARGMFSSSSAPESIKDPQARKEYEAYLKNAQDIRNQRIAAGQVSQLRGFELKTIRQKLVYLYGEDRTKWDELRQVVTETIPDPEVAQLVIKDFTRRKEPGIWP